MLDPDKAPGRPNFWLKRVHLGTLAELIHSGYVVACLSRPLALDGYEEFFHRSAQSIGESLEFVSSRDHFACQHAVRLRVTTVHDPADEGLLPIVSSQDRSDELRVQSIISADVHLE